VLRQLQQKYGERMRIVYRDFPLSIHPQAPKAAEAGECANEQGRFWEMHDRLFDVPGLTIPDLKKRAAELQLDTSRFDQCLDSGKYAAEVRADIADGQKYGVSATPTFFVNGRMISGANMQKLSELIDDELAMTGAVVAASALKH
jgi:protein-disulfide isomerase